MPGTERRCRSTPRSQIESGLTLRRRTGGAVWPAVRGGGAPAPPLGPPPDLLGVSSHPDRSEDCRLRLSGASGSPGCLAYSSQAPIPCQGSQRRSCLWSLVLTLAVALANRSRSRIPDVSFAFLACFKQSEWVGPLCLSLAVSLVLSTSQFPGLWGRSLCANSPDSSGGDE